MKRLVRTKCFLKEIILRLLQFTYQTNSSKDVEDNIVQDSLVEILSKNIVLGKIREDYTSYVYNKCLIQFIQASNFQATKYRANHFNIVSYDKDYTTKYKILVKNGKFECDCAYSNQWGLPCSHMFSLNSIDPSKLYDYLPFFTRWEKHIIFQQNDDELIKYLEEELVGDNKGIFISITVNFFIYVGNLKEEQSETNETKDDYSYRSSDSSYISGDYSYNSNDEVSDFSKVSMLIKLIKKELMS